MNIFRKYHQGIVGMALAAMLLAACDKDVFDINTDPFKDEIYKTALEGLTACSNSPRNMPGSSSSTTR